VSTLSASATLCISEWLVTVALRQEGIITTVRWTLQTVASKQQRQVMIRHLHLPPEATAPVYKLMSTNVSRYQQFINKLAKESNKCKSSPMNLTIQVSTQFVILAITKLWKEYFIIYTIYYTFALIPVTSACLNPGNLLPTLAHTHTNKFCISN